MQPSVAYKVPGLSQPDSNLCWWTCFKMLTLYHRNKGVTVNQLRNVETNANAMALYAQNQTTSAEEIEDIAANLGFSALAATLTGRGLLELMSKNGPVMYCGLWADGSGGHCVILTGTNGKNVSINDPWGGVQANSYNKIVGEILIQDTALVYFDKRLQN